jgi:subtilisin family serine protease
MRSRSPLRWLLAAAPLVLGITACSDEPTRTADPGVSQPALSALESTAPARPVPGQYIVVFKEDRAANVPALVQALVTAPGDSVLFVYQHAIKGFAARLSPASVEAIGKHPAVDRITPDEYGTKDELWNLDRIDQRNLPLNNSYAPNRDGSGVNVYIIDTGVRKSHREFDWGLRARHGYTAIFDGRGSDDCDGHGTHVAATALGTNYGVAKKAMAYSVRIGDCAGSSSVSLVLAGLDWLAANRVLPAVANLSFGFSARSDIDDATQKVINSGVTFVTSAGNFNTDACNFSPKRMSNVITVAASNSSDWRWSESNWGSCVKVFAPGVDILSAGIGSDTDVRTLTGTSMASPHGAGVAALYLQGDPGASPSKVLDAVLGSATFGVIQDTRGSPNSLLYAFPVYFAINVTGPNSISSFGNHTWEAMPEGGDGSYTYQWSVYYYKTGETHSLGTGKTQDLFVYLGSGDFGILVDATSAGMTKSASMYVSNGGV